MAMTEQSISTTKLSDTILLLRPSSMLDNYSAPEMIELLSMAIAENIQYVIVDLENVEFISSAGAGSLIGNVESFRSRGGDLIICNATETVLHVFNILDLSDYLTIRSDLSQVKALLQSAD